MRDSQKSKVYHWQATLRNKMTPLRNPLKESLSSKRTYHAIAVNMYGERSAKVKQHARRITSEYHNWREEIRFRTNADLLTILHESAHHILLRTINTTGHGPLYVRVLIDMMVAFKMESEEVLMRQALLHGVQVAAKSEVPRPKLDTLPNFLREEV